jgi:hypothetical protein
MSVRGGEVMPKETNEAAAVRRRVVVLRTTLLGFANCAESYHRLYHYLPEPGSVVVREIETLDSPTKDALPGAAIVLGAARDHLVGLECLLAAESSVYAPITVGRALLEASARAWWLLDPSIDARERLARTLTDRLANIREQAKIARAIAERGGQTKDLETLDRINARLDHVAAIARRHGLRVFDDDKGRPVAVGASRLSSTILVGRLLAGHSGDTVFGEVAWRAWSGTTHSTGHGLTAVLAVEPDPAGKHELIAHPRITLGDVESTVAIAAMAFGEAFNREVELYGWERRDWDAYARQALTDLRASMPPP